MAAEQRLLDEILQNYAPDYWTSTSRSTFVGRRYIRRTISSNDAAYNMAIKDMPNDYRILQVDVIENPYQYGRFLIRKEQLKKQGKTVVVKQMYHPVLEKDVDQALEYNCDTRYYNADTNYMQCASKKTRLYARPENCESFFNGYRRVFIVLSVLDDGYTSSDVYPDFDTHYYPMFVVIVT